MTKYTNFSQCGNHLEWLAHTLTVLIKSAKSFISYVLSNNVVTNQLMSLENRSYWSAYDLLQNSRLTLALLPHPIPTPLDDWFNQHCISRAPQGCPIWRPNRVWLASNGTNLGLFKISFSIFAGQVLYAVYSCFF